MPAVVAASHAGAVFPPWPLPRLSALGTALDNALLCLPAPWTVHSTGITTTVRPLSSTIVGFVPACRGTLVWRGHLWMWELDSLRLLRLHGALRDLPPEDLARILPSQVRLAALELLLDPLLRESEKALNDAVTLRDMHIPEADAATAPAVDMNATILLEILLDAGEGLREMTLCRLAPRQAEAGHALIQALHAGKPRLHAAMENVTLSVSVLAGHVYLPLLDVSALALGDVILPDDFPAARGHALLLLPPARDGMKRFFPCTLAGRTLTVNGPHTLVMEPVMSSQAPDAPDTPNTPDTPPSLELEHMDVELCFELERRTITLAEIASLAPGSVLTLATDVASPVTLRAGGMTLGTGRLVDVDGALGVQVVTLAHRQK